MACKSEPKCPKQLSFNYSLCITDSALVKNLIIGTWNWVQTDDQFSGTFSNPCYSGQSMKIQFDTAGNYKYFANGNLEREGHYVIKGDTAAVIHDSLFFNSGCGICDGYLGIRSGPEAAAFYSKQQAQIMRECGITVVDSPAAIGETMAKVLGAVAAK